MYGRGHYALPFGQGLQRPMPPYQQQPPGAQFQQGCPFPPPQAGFAPSVPPLGSGYPCPPPAPPASSQQGLPIPPPPLAVPPPLQHPYLVGQHNYSSGTLNPQHTPVPPPPSSGGPPQFPPPPPPYGQTLYGPPGQPVPHSSQQGIQSTPLPPPPLPTVAVFSCLPNIDSAKQSVTAESQMPSVGPQAPPLPPSSPPRPPPPPCSSSPAKSSPAPVSASASSSIQPGSTPISDKVFGSECGAGIASHGHNRDDVGSPNEDLSRGRSALEDLPPPPPKPTDEKIVRNIEVLCQFVAKNGAGFEEMARQKESGNPHFKFLFGGEPGSEASCAHEYYLWMKKKYGLVSSSLEGQGSVTLSQRHEDADSLVQPNSLTIIRATHSPADSDVDMEDDITQSEKEPVVDPVEDKNPKSIWTGDSLEKQKQESSLQYSGDSRDLHLGQPVKSLAAAETKSAESSGHAARLDSPFRLIQSYASDDSSGEDGEPSCEELKTVGGSLSHKAGAISSHENMDSKSHLASEAGISESAELRPENILIKDLENPQAVQSGRSSGVEGSSSADFFQGKKANENRCVIEKEDEDHVLSALRVDEFGRLVKEGGSDSESDNAYRTRRRDKRDRSCSRSASERRKRRSPRRRKDRRSRSRSWSPRRRRSRSRSPYRPGGDLCGEKPKRDKVQSRQCFDFLKGRCYRGASCRYMHHEPDRSDSSRRYKNKEDHLEGISSSRNPDFHGGTVTSRLRLENNEVKGEKMDSHLGKHDGVDLTSRHCDEKSKEESIDGPIQPNVLQRDFEALLDFQKCQRHTEGQAQVHGASKEAVSHVPTGEEPPTSGMPSVNELAIGHSRDEASAQAHHIPDDSQEADSSTRSDVAAVRTSAVSQSELPFRASYPGKVSNDTTAQINPTLDFSHQTFQLPAPSLPSQPASSSQTSSLQIDNKLMASSVSLLPQSLPVESLPPYQASLPNQQSHYSVPPNPLWSIPPPPQLRPQYTGGLSMPGAPLSFQQGDPSLRTDFPIRTYQMHAPFRSQAPVPFTSFAPGNMPPPPVLFPGDSTVKSMQSFPGGNPLPAEPPKPTFENQTFPQQMQLPYGPQLTAADSMSSYHVGSLPVSGYSSDPLSRDHSARFLEIGGSRIPAHYNPYASTFDKPLTSRFSSSAFAQEREVATGGKYDSSSAVGNAPGEGQNISSHGPRAGGQSLPRSAGDQYDPLFDSMEPSSESFKKNSRKQGHAADNSDILKLSSRYKVLDVEENNKQKEVGAVAAATSLENDEFGETADAEVGAVENGSPSNPNDDDDAIVAEGEIEIDQVKSEGKSKKNKDSRSMKLFKIAVANFVKEVLKPQWRQGNMSKEVFKTIVKKTVEKVSGAMKSRRMPKSQAKIDHYIDSQRRKLTQLVEGYVSKYKI